MLHFNRRSLRTKVFSTLLSLLLVMALASFLTGSGMFQRSLLTFEQHQARAELDRATQAIASDGLAMQRIVRDYGVWDDTYEYMETRNTTFLDNNFTPDSMSNLAVDFVAFADAELKTLHGRAFDAASNRLLSLPDELVEPLREMLRQLPAAYAQEGQSGPKGLFRIQSVQGVPLLLGISSVLDAAKTQPSRGWIVFGRQMTAARWAEIGLRSGVKLGWSWSEGSGHSDSVIRDTLGGTPLHLRLLVPPSLDAQRQTAQTLLAANSLVIMLLAAFGAVWLLDRLILRRLALFSRLAEQGVDSAGKPLNWPVTGADELDRLANDHNELMLKLQQTRVFLEEESRRDALTGLGNRKHLMERVQWYLHLKSRQHELAIALCVIDLDGFKLINDSLGHEAGDHVLQEVAERLRAVLRRSDSAIRLGGDEFAVVCIGGQRALGVSGLVERILMAVRQPIVFQNLALSVSCSIGIAVAENGEETDVATLLRNADIAMYHAKQQGKDRYSSYSESMYAVVFERLRLEQDLRAALVQQKLEVWFQPIIDCSLNRIVMVEALVRWPTEKGYCPPDVFIPVAEESGLIGELGMMVARLATQALVRIRKVDPNLQLNINLSVNQLLNANLSQVLCAQVDACSLPRHAVHFELTEGVFAHDKCVLNEQLCRLVEAGFSLHLDDFGTGYSSLLRLQSLPMSALKLDKSFTQQIGCDERIAHVILSLGEQLGMQVIAEGVETEGQCLRLIQMGCTLMQGYLFAKPMPESQLMVWLEANASGFALLDVCAGKSVEV